MHNKSCQSSKYGAEKSQFHALVLYFDDSIYFYYNLPIKLKKKNNPQKKSQSEPHNLNFVEDNISRIKKRDFYSDFKVLSIHV